MKKQSWFQMVVDVKKDKEAQMIYKYSCSKERVQIMMSIIIFILFLEFIANQMLHFNCNITFNLIIISIIFVCYIFKKINKKRLVLNIHINNIIFTIITILVVLSFIIQYSQKINKEIKNDYLIEKLERKKINEEWRAKGYKCIEKQLFYETETKNVVPLNKECDF